ncbi:nitrilase-related carbon-nitrogen hydrolase [Vibrio sp. PP-XX7]
MKLNVALGQFAIAKEWQTNLETCKRYIKEASEQQIQLLVFPEGILAQDIADPELVRKAAQPLDGEFMSALLAYSQAFSLTVIMTVHVPTDADQTKVWNTQVAIRAGKVIAEYRKLHLYDAFAVKESENVVAGNEIPIGRCRWI